MAWLTTNSDKLDEYIRSIVIPGYDFDLSQGEEQVDIEESSKTGNDTNYTNNNKTRLLFLFTSVLAVVTTIWHLIWYITPVVDGVPFLATHLALMGTTVFLTTVKLEGEKKTKVLWNATSIILAIALVLANVYVFLNYTEFPRRAGAPTQMDIYISSILVLLTIEGARRAYGNVFGVIGIAAIVYGLFGEYFPGFLQTSGQSWERLVTGVVVPDLVGLYGFLLNLSAVLITIFIFFGIFLQVFGGAEFFGGIALKIGRNVRSGPAQVSIISSGLMGMLNGTAVANVAATGAFTIPLMKEMGYDDEFAGAIESVASIGGQLTPPIMGAAAFVMASILGRPFIEIIAAATIPAVLYYFTLMATAHIRAVKVGMEPYDGEVPSILSIIIRSYFFIPVLVIIYSLISGNQASHAALQGLLWLIALYFAFTLLNNRGSLGEGLREASVTLIKAFDSGTRAMAPLVLLLAELAWIIQLLNTTGILNEIAAGLIFLGGGELLFVLILAAFVSIVFGFGIPTTAAYIIVALVGAPAIVQLGVDPVSAHLFVFYFAILSAITPPVAAACLVATGISGGRFLTTCLKAMQIAFPAFVFPFIWIYNPAIIGEGSTLEILITVVIIALAMLLVVSVFENFLIGRYTIYERSLAGLSGFLLVVPSDITRILGLIGFSVTIAVQLHRSQIKIQERAFAIINK